MPDTIAANPDQLGAAGTRLSTNIRRPILHDAAFFVALLSTALALGGAVAHVLELPNKIDLSRDQYFIVQTIYAGWNRLAYLLAIQFVSIISVIILSRHAPRVYWPALLALLGLIAAQVVFWTTTFPANTATNNWTAAPQNWEVLRQQWEYSHATGAAFQVLAMCALIIAALARSRQQSPPHSAQGLMF